MASCVVMTITVVACILSWKQKRRTIGREEREEREEAKRSCTPERCLDNVLYHGNEYIHLFVLVICGDESLASEPQSLHPGKFGD